MEISGLKCTDVRAEIKYGHLTLEIEGANLPEAVEVSGLVAAYGADHLLDGIGGFEDWLEKGNADPDAVAEWLQERGYRVEKDL